MNFRRITFCFAMILAMNLSSNLFGDTVTNLTLTDSFITDAQSPAVTGLAVNHGLLVEEPAGSGTFVPVQGVALGDFVVRERRNAGQTNRRIASFLEFDVSSLTAADVATPGFTATFSADWVSRLNDLNVAPVAVGSVASAWDSATSAPTYDLTVSATNLGNLVDNLRLPNDDAGGSTPADNPTGATFTLDVTSTVTDWVNGTADNNGLVLYIPILESQAAGFSNVGLTTVVPIAIPEPASASLIGLAVCGLLIRRRR